MKRLLLFACAAGCAISAVPAQAGIAWDATGDWAPGFTGPLNPDLDVVRFAVAYDSVTSTFRLTGTMAGMIDRASPGFYVIGANTGTGPSAPFGGLGQPDVRFNQVIIVRKDRTGQIGANPLGAANIQFWDDKFSVMVPLALLPSTGFAPMNYGFNLWPRGSGAQAISDFSPENSTLSAVPEPAAWGMMIAGLAAVGSCMRLRRRGHLTFA